MDIQIYFKQLELHLFNQQEQDKNEKIAHWIKAYKEGTAFPSLENVDIAIIGVEENRNAFNNKECAKAPDAVRKHFYQLFCGTISPRIVDLGNIKQGNTVEDTYFALADVIAVLVAKKIVPVILGGSHDLTYANYKAYENLKQYVNMFVLDNKFDLGDPEQPISSQSYLSKILVAEPNYLFNYTNAGYQSYFVNTEAVELMNNLYFEAYRLGVLREDLQEVEPMVRNADMVSIDISAVRFSDAPGNENAAPAGFFAEEVCQIARYAGMSDKLSSIGFYEINPVLDAAQQTAKLTATMMWYFIEGYYQRKNDFPAKYKDEYKKYVVANSNDVQDMVFLKSKKSGRWWMEIPCDQEHLKKYEHHYLIPCSYKDYQKAQNDEIPDRWWLAFKKLM